MRPTQKILIAFAVVVGIIAIGVGIGWLSSRGTAPGPEAGTPVPPPLTDPGAPAPNPTPSVTHTPLPTSTPVRPVRNVDPGSPTPVAPSPGMSAGPATPAWEDKLNEVLGAEDEDTNKARILLELFPTLPEEGQVEVAEHLLNLLAGENTAPLANMLKDPKTSEAVQDVILSDALNWPDSAKLPLLLDVARTDEHPKREEAKDWFELYIGEDYGTDWVKWEQAMKDYLKAHPDE